MSRAFLWSNLFFLKYSGKYVQLSSDWFIPDPFASVSLNLGIKKTSIWIMLIFMFKNVICCSDLQKIPNLEALLNAVGGAVL